jgi:hypothetical protein
MSPQVSWLFFKGGPTRTGGKAPISGFIRVESGNGRTEKQPTSRGPEGCVELKRFLKALFDRNHDACRPTLERPGVKGCKLVDLPSPAAFRTHVFQR